MAVLNKQEIVESGLAATYSAAASGGDTFVNNGAEFLHVKNGGAGSITVTVTAQATGASNKVYGALTKSNVSVAVGAGADKFIGPFPPAAFNTGDSASVTYSAATSVTIAVITLKKY